MAGNKARKVVIAGVFSALVIVLGITGLGFIPLPLGAVTILQVPVIIAAILEGPAVGAFVGLLFGVFSIIQAAVAGVTPVDLAFLTYPWIALIPRVLIGPVAWFFYSLLSGSLFPRPETPETCPAQPHVLRETLAVLTGAVLGSLVNTVLVLSAFVLVLPNIVTWQVVLVLAASNGAVEIAFSAVLSLAVILPWKRIPRRGGRSKLTSE